MCLSCCVCRLPMYSVCVSLCVCLSLRERECEGTGASLHSVSNWKIPSCHARNVIILYITSCCKSVYVLVSVCVRERGTEETKTSEERKRGIKQV